MKKVLIFIAGIVTGAILMLVIAALIGNSSNGESSNNGMTFFEKEGDCISENNFEVFQGHTPQASCSPRFSQQM